MSAPQPAETQEAQPLAEILARMKPPRRGFEPFHKYFSPESNDYPFKPNMRLLFSLMPYLCASKKLAPKQVLCPMAGVGAAPIMVLAYYTNAYTKVAAWEDEAKWREILQKNFQRNHFCEGRWRINPIEELEDKSGDAAVFCPPPSPDFEKFNEAVSKTLELLHAKLKKGSSVIIVSRRLELALDEVFYTELALEHLVDTSLYNLIQVATVRARTPQRRLYNEEAQKDVFIILRRR
ncbi:MAG: hypothetical protein QW692_00140 [Nitrososphaerota archaeon]